MKSRDIDHVDAGRRFRLPVPCRTAGLARQTPQIRHQDPDQVRTNSAQQQTIPSPCRRSEAAVSMYHQQTKNILCSYSPKKLGFF